MPMLSPQGGLELRKQLRAPALLHLFSGEDAHTTGVKKGFAVDLKKTSQDPIWMRKTDFVSYRILSESE